MKFTLLWLKDHLETDAGAATIAEKTPPSASKSSRWKMPARG